MMGRKSVAFGRFFFNRIQYSWLSSSSICLLDRLVVRANIFFKALYIFFMASLFLSKPCSKKDLKAWELCTKIFFVNHQKILTLFNVVAMASSCNDLDRDDNAKFIVATIKRIRNILWNILFFTMFLYGYLE